MITSLVIVFNLEFLVHYTYQSWAYVVDYIVYYTNVLITTTIFGQRSGQINSGE